MHILGGEHNGGILETDYHSEQINREADSEISSLMRFKDGTEQDTKYKRKKIKLGMEGGDT